MKKAKVIFKKDKKENPGNYRLINLTLVSWKLVEQILLKAVTRQVQDKNLWEQPAKIYHEKIVPDQLSCLVQSDDWLWG